MKSQRIEADANPKGHPHGTDLILGTLWGALSCVGYATTNVFLRQLASDCDPVWVTCMKAAPTFAIASCLTFWQARAADFVWPARRLLATILSTALLVQLVGNTFLQWSLGVIGLALTVPLSFGTLIGASAVMGRAVLGEPITWRSLTAMLLLTASIVFLATSAGETTQQLPQEAALSHGPLLVALGVVAACLTGIAYAWMAVVLRVSARSLTTATTLFLISGTGFVSLGIAAFLHLGPRAMLATPSSDFAYMLLAGAFNAVGFYALHKSLSFISVVHANVLNAGQAAIAAVTGVVIFHEPSTWPLWSGVMLTALGLIVISTRPSPIEIERYEMEH